MKMNKIFMAGLYGAAVGLLLFHGQHQAMAKLSEADMKEDQRYTVWRVIDGDSLKLDADEKISLIGVDTPELFLSRKLYNQSRSTGEKMENIKIKGKLAQKFTKQLVEGKKVRLRFDEQIRDKRDQIWAYVYLEDETFVNAEIIRQGYGRAVEMPPNIRYGGYFMKLEEEAKLNKRGLWQYQKT